MEQNTKPSDTNLYFHAAIAERGKQINSSFSNEHIKPDYVEKDNTHSAVIDRFLHFGITNPDGNKIDLYYAKSNRSDECQSHFTLIIRKNEDTEFFSLNVDGLYKNGEKVENIDDIKKAQNYLIIIQNCLENQEITAPTYRRTDIETL